LPAMRAMGRLRLPSAMQRNSHRHRSGRELDLSHHLPTDLWCNTL
jgi:hypothetical protein